ncbi:GGDEF domain-containing protein [Leisingera methylohalidivorans]|uniref:diguanylate cyclase n=1 Tax=Leisingera methylohalidivorans DSM 14336 TaxID=999552 RepID=V9VR74_9RHOB|nr:GGDEF domain-containing protein [Leisingera methylohalidivorans]AHC99809.1 diguanylate cyclase [Leisingera methylohalidivorans DSM 14336]
MIPGDSFGDFMLAIRTNGQKWYFVACMTVVSVAVSWAVTGLTAPEGLSRAALVPSTLAPLLIAPVASYWAACRLLEIHVLNEKLMNLAAHDQMTSLYSRDHFFRLIAGLGGNFKGSFLLADIDRFKSINDTHGHQAGDEVIRFVAGVLKAGVQPGGIAARFGGEEFVAWMPDVSLQAAMHKAEEIRQAVGAHALSVGAESLLCSVSIGLGYHDGSRTVEAVLREADEALYAAKNSGRNQVKSTGRM